jgi:hypothetical protein
MLKEFAGGRILTGDFRINHEGIGLAACPVVVQNVFFLDLEGALARAALPYYRLVPSLVGFPPDHEVPGKMLLLLRFNIPFQPTRNGHSVSS